ncbi:RNA polymerase sigma factor SigM [Tsukamurella paurometabola]|uniref:RNA polymerase sigma factor SigM n=1 Tax=Tsukamurella paurometabola TaxID=2061 RepID=A0A3P8K029_TSUPA|nr:RNA polymerase sigma factor SigM [Tsukamurella paurometabola]MBS4101795.1 RNA polymerase sigma factor SigM [Tsukamurella paurometabola]UEA81413.1 RNA polymerase sigma factor SigM [Tsukamurella paurometabola]VDR38404.1 Sigma-24 [Tsukamurella paurometabola]
MTEWGNTISRSAGAGDPATDAPDTSGHPWGRDHDGVSDECLLAAAAAGDGDAFAELFLRHARQLRATALRTIRDCTDAEDCLQDAMLRAFQLSPTFRGDCKVGSWLHRIVVNACLDRARRNQVRTSLPMPDDLSCLASDEGRTAEELDRRLSVEAALRMLPEDQRAAVVAVDMHGLSVTQAAELLGVAPGTVKSRRARARIRLERLLR